MSGRVTLSISLQPSCPWKSSIEGSAAWSIVPIAPSATRTRSASKVRKRSERLLNVVDLRVGGSALSLSAGGGGAGPGFRSLVPPAPAPPPRAPPPPAPGGRGGRGRGGGGGARPRH